MTPVRPPPPLESEPAAAERPQNGVRERRELARLTQGALARQVGLSRQSVHAIETGRALPAVDVALRLARAFDCSVEDLFEARGPEARLDAEPAGAAVGGRVALAHLAERWVAYPLGREGVSRSADAIATPLGKRVALQLLRSSDECRQNVPVMGCAPALGLLAERLNGQRGPGRFLWLGQSSTAALEALSRAHTLVAGVHLIDGRTGEANVPDVRRHAAGRDLVMFALGSWEVGFVVAPGNPKRIRAAEQLVQRRLRLVVREPGSGARRLLEHELARAGVPSQVASRAPLRALAHLEVVQAIAMGAADVGVAPRDAALAFGLGFIPIAEERYDLVVPAGELGDPRLARLLDTLNTRTFRSELSALGYDSSRSGERVAEVRAA